jgi:TolB-like protein/class 3 adenylate cyclase/Flp pilus assembly protein TadD
MSTTRRLAAILAADVAGYSRLMGTDEVGTLAALKAARREVVDPQIAAHNGRIVKTTGDGMLVEFASVVDAVTCAMAVQETMAGRGGALAFRIGINVGDIIIDGDDIFGDGVNVAARVEGECQPGGVYLSDDAFRQVRSKTPFNFDDFGETALKNIDRPIRIYGVRMGASAALHVTLSEAGKPLPLPDKPSIAVLPFQNMSGDPEQEYFADGMVEDIITALSRFKSLFVIARNSSFTYKGKAVEIKRVGRELGVRYVLEGSVRKAGGRVRITGQLIEAATGAHLWAEKFDGAFEDVFELQDRVAEQVVATIAPTVERAEILAAHGRGTRDPNAYEFYIRGLAKAVEYDREATDAALVYYDRALRLDPKYATAHGRIAVAICTKTQFGWLGSADETRLGVRHARLAIEHSGDDAVALADGGMALAFLAHEVEAGAAFVNQATELNANSATVWHRSGWVNVYAGKPEVALDHLARARRLSPVDIQMQQILTVTAAASFYAGRYADAISWADLALQRHPGFRPALNTLAAAKAMLGDVAGAKQAVAHMLALYPKHTITRWSGGMPLRREADMAAITTAMRLAGVPE